MSKKYRGHISKWIDSKGYGFISPINQHNTIFFHISTLKTRARRPRVGDNVHFEIIEDTKKRLQAINVYIDDVGELVTVAPKKASYLDFFAVIVLFSVTAIGSIYYFSAKQFDLTTAILIGCGLFCMVLLARPKKPRQSHFNCSHCLKRTAFTKRTIRAWNNRVTRFYCNQCYQPKEYPDFSMHKRNRTMYPRNREGLGGIIILVLVILLVAFIAKKSYTLLVGG